MFTPNLMLRLTNYNRDGAKLFSAGKNGTVGQLGSWATGQVADKNLLIALWGHILRCEFYSKPLQNKKPKDVYALGHPIGLGL